MIKIKVFKKNNIIDEITLSGHANYSHYGTDIVCASVSSMVISSINGIIIIDKEAILYDIEKETRIVNIKKDDITNLLLENLVNMLDELEVSYPKNIIIRKEERK